MFNLFLRVATATLLAAITFLIYNNYIRSAAIPDFQVDHAALESPPELPKLAPAPEIPETPSLAAARETSRAAAPVIKRTAPAIDDGPIAEIIDTTPLAEVVELPRRGAPIAMRALQTASLAPREDAQPARQPEARHHTVQSGESLWVIARKYYGNGELYNKVAEANGITNTNRVRAGQVLTIPDLNAPVAAVRISEELADHEDAPRLMPVSFSRDLSVRGKTEIRRK